MMEKKGKSLRLWPLCLKLVVSARKHLTQEGLASQEEGRECCLRAQQVLGRGRDHRQLGKGAKPTPTPEAGDA